MKYLNITLAILIILCKLDTYSQFIDDEISKQISELRQSGIDTIICYYEDCNGENALPFRIDTNCVVLERKYLYWVKNGHYYRQNFNNCTTSNEFSIENSNFLNLCISNLVEINNAEIKQIEHLNKKKKGKTIEETKMIVTISHSCFNNFIFYIKDLKFTKSINQFYLETKMLDDKNINDNYENNQKSILKLLIDTIQKEL